MQGLKYFLDKYKTLTPPDAVLRGAVCEACSEVLKFPVEKREVRIIRGVAYLSLSPGQKTSILLHKEKILEHINRVLEKKAIHDVR